MKIDRRPPKSDGGGSTRRPIRSRVGWRRRVTSEGVVSARRLARLCERDDVYRWFCGGVGVNHRTLGEFRVDHGELLNRLLAQSVMALAAEGLIDYRD